MPGNLASYAFDCGAEPNCNIQSMVTTALIAAAADYTMTNYDHIMFYHAGNGQETSGVDADIWSFYSPDSITAGGKTFPGYTMVPETEVGADPLGVICHEYGHQLGLPDLYDTSTGFPTLGPWDIMDTPYTGSPQGSNPPHLGAWSKIFLGFFSGTAAPDGALQLGPASSTQAGTRKITVPGQSAEYFLLEYRLSGNPAADYDQDLAMSGLVVWHIDDAIALNSTVLANNVVNAPSLSGLGHRGVDLVEQDGVEPVSDLGTGDVFTDGQTFGPPKSNSFAGTGTGVAVTQIAGAGSSTLSMQVSILREAPSLAIHRVANYPNPGGDPGKYAARAGAPAGTITTLVLQASQALPAGEMSLDIYDIDGTLVRSVPGSALTLQAGSSDEKWIYEYDWNGKSASGEDVASGVYLYRFEANGRSKAGKAVVIR